MIGWEEFTTIFGNISVLQVAELLLACIFLYYIYKKASNYLINKHDTDREQNERIDKALSVVNKFPEIENAIKELNEAQSETVKRLAKMEEDIKRRERNKLCDRLLQNYRYYSNPNTNPSKSWTRMEAEAFWELFRDYEDAGGDGFMHTEVQPAMEHLTVLDNKKECLNS